MRCLACRASNGDEALEKPSPPVGNAVVSLGLGRCIMEPVGHRRRSHAFQKELHVALSVPWKRFIHFPGQIQCRRRGLTLPTRDPIARWASSFGPRRRLKPIVSTAIIACRAQTLISKTSRISPRLSSSGFTSPPACPGLRPRTTFASHPPPSSARQVGTSPSFQPSPIPRPSSHSRRPLPESLSALRATAHFRQARASSWVHRRGEVARAGPWEMSLSSGYRSRQSRFSRMAWSGHPRQSPRLM